MRERVCVSGCATLENHHRHSLSRLLVSYSAHAAKRKDKPPIHTLSQTMALTLSSGAACGSATPAKSSVLQKPGCFIGVYMCVCVCVCTCVSISSMIFMRTGPASASVVAFYNHRHTHMTYLYQRNRDTRRCQFRAEGVRRRFDRVLGGRVGAVAGEGDSACDCVGDLCSSVELSFLG